MIDTREQQIYWEKPITRKNPQDETIAAFVRPKIAYITKHLTLPDNARILDVGCGNGYFTYYLESMGTVTALDYSAAMLQMNPCSSLVQGSAFQLPFSDQSFDLVFCSNLLHHLDDAQLAIQEMKRVATRHMVILEPNRNNPAMLALGLLKSEERACLKYTLSLVCRFAVAADLKVVAGATMGFVTPNRMPNLIVKLLKKLNSPNPFGAYSVVVLERVG